MWLMSIVFEARAYDGRRVRLTEVQWLHMVFFHPEVEVEQARIRQVLENPEVVIEGATRDTRIYYKFNTPVSKPIVPKINITMAKGIRTFSTSPSAGTFSVVAVCREVSTSPKDATSATRIREQRGQMETAG